MPFTNFHKGFTKASVWNKKTLNCLHLKKISSKSFIFFGAKYTWSCRYCTLVARCCPQQNVIRSLPTLLNKFLQFHQERQLEKSRNHIKGNNKICIIMHTSKWFFFRYCRSTAHKCKSAIWPWQLHTQVSQAWKRKPTK